MDAPTPVFPPLTRPPARRLVATTAWRPVGQPLLPFDDAVPAGRAAPGVPAELARVARTVTVVLAEALTGRRPVAQVDAFADGTVHATIVHVVRSRLAHGLLLRSLRIQGPTEHAAEVAFHLGDGTRSRAGALRVELGRRGWRCVALELALTPSGVAGTALDEPV